jgi:hypothetical protein
MYNIKMFRQQRKERQLFLHFYTHKASSIKMGRRRGGGGGFSRKAPTARGSGALPPSTRRTEGGGSLLGGVASMIGQGMMWGAGSGIGHRVTDSIMGPRTIAYESAQNNEEGASSSSSNGAVVDARTNPCAGPMELFGKCLEQNTDNVAQCQAFADLLTSCKRDL